MSVALLPRGCEGLVVRRILGRVARPGGTTHLAFYAGWPKAMSAIAVAKKLFTAEPA